MERGGEGMGEAQYCSLDAQLAFATRKKAGGGGATLQRRCATVLWLRLGHVG